FATLLLASIAALGCREPRIDGSSPERTRRTITAARASLPPEQRRDFDRYLDLLMRRGADPPMIADPRVRAQINGRTGPEIIKAGETILREDAERRMNEKAKAELAEINASFDRAEADQRKLGPVDDDVRALCQHQSDPNLVRRCEWREMLANEKCNGP